MPIGHHVCVVGPPSKVENRNQKQPYQIDVPHQIPNLMIHFMFVPGRLQVILGLDHMHRRYIVYLDLKPANILLDENGHVRISDLGLACDFSKKKPHASVGTHGYMAPEVLSKGTPYDSSADWFSFGCMLYKLLKGHSPFRQHKTKDKHEIDRMTLTMVSDFDGIYVLLFLFRIFVFFFSYISTESTNSAVYRCHSDKNKYVLHVDLSWHVG